MKTRVKGMLDLRLCLHEEFEMSCVNDAMKARSKNVIRR